MSRPKRIHPLVIELIARRNALGWSREHVAKAAGLHWGTIYALERGDGSPTLITFTLWAGALGMTLTVEAAA
jgi:transcriptional regulator with XRE-family HTH domain